MFNRHSLAYRGLAGLLCLTISLLPLHAVATDQQREAGLQGQQEGQVLLEQWQLPAIENGQLQLPAGEGIELVDLHELFPGTAQGSLDAITSVYGSDADMNQLGEDTQQQLAQDPSVTGEAYRVLTEVSDRARPDMANDPLWAMTDAVQSAPNIIAETFPGCDQGPSPTPDYRQCDRVNIPVQSCTLHHPYTAGIIEHVAGPLNLRSCGEGCLEVWIGRIGNNYWGGHCTVFEQSITLRIVNPDAITSATLDYVKWDDYMQVWLGDRKVWSGPDGRFPPETPGRCELATEWQRNPGTDLTRLLKDVKPGLEVPVKIRVSVTGGGEGYARIKVHYDPDKLVINDVWTPEACLEQAREFQANFSDVTIACTEQPSAPNGCAVVNGITVCESQFEPSPLPGISPLCRRVQVNANADSYRNRTHTACGVLEADQNCGFIASRCMEEDDNGRCLRFTDTYDCGLAPTDPACVVSGLLPTTFEECQSRQTITPFTETKHVPDYEVCERTLGAGESSENTQGDTQTVDSEATTSTDTCQALEQNPACTFVRSECTEGGAGHDGSCHLESRIYDCGEDVTIENAQMIKEYNCPGPIRCMGTDCLEPTAMPQANFAAAAAMLNAAQTMTNDMNCTGTDGNSDVTCTIFSGTESECKKAVGGTVDCCEKPSGISLSDYIGLVAAVNKLDTAAMAMDPSSAVYGSWNTLREPMTSTWSAVKQPLVSAWDSLMGAGPSTATQAGAEQAATSFMQAMTNKTAEWVGSTFGSGAQSALFSNVGGAAGADGVMTGGNFALGGTAGAALSTVMAAYMIYSVSMILVQLIWKCEEREFELNAKRALKSCHYVGSYCKSKVLGSCVEKRQAYCCFSSPLSRILQEQVRPQLGMGWGSAKSPSCGGLTASQLNQVDWSQVNLDEWIGILSLTGHMPDIPSLNLDQLTGGGSTLNVDGRRDDAADRARQRLDGLDVNQLKLDSSREMDNAGG